MSIKIPSVQVPVFSQDKWRTCVRKQKPLMLNQLKPKFRKVQSVSDLLKANIPTSDQIVRNPSTTNQNDHPVSRSISQSGLNTNQQTVTNSHDRDKKTVIIGDSQ
mgnify:CR=1 FL=1